MSSYFTGRNFSVKHKHEAKKSVEYLRPKEG